MNEEDKKQFIVSSNLASIEPVIGGELPGT